RDFLHEQDFVFVSVSLNVSRVDGFQRNGPLNLTDFPARWQLPFQFRGKAGVARKFPVSMPVRSHSQQQADSKWLSGDNRARIRQELRFDELFSLIRLAE